LRVVVFLLVSVAYGQPRAVELFGHAGALRFAGDEGSLGSAVSFGGAFLVPVARRLAVDVDLQTSRLATGEIGPPNHFTQRRTFLSPSIVYRAGSERVYGFAGGGLGLQHNRTNGTFTFSSAGGPTQTAPFTSSDTGLTLHGVAGVVGAITPRLLIRGDAFLAFRYVLPSVGARIGIGIRF
jgi:hypothetical protein